MPACCTPHLTVTQLAARAHKLNPAFSPKYHQATWIENAFFDYVIVGLKPAFRYPAQINKNLIAQNYFAMTLQDKAFCERLIGPLERVLPSRAGRRGGPCCDAAHRRDPSPVAVLRQPAYA